MSHLYRITLKTEEKGLFDITKEVQQKVTESGVKEGICLVFCPHTTASITINENADDDVRRDVNLALNTVFPRLEGFRHDEGNSDCHVKCSVLGASETLIVTEGKLLLGKWQDVYFAEFDPPRTRTVYIKVLEG